MVTFLRNEIQISNDLTFEEFKEKLFKKHQELWKKWEIESFDLNTPTKNSNNLLNLVTQTLLDQLRNKYKIEHFTATYDESDNDNDRESDEEDDKKVSDLEISKSILLASQKYKNYYLKRAQYNYSRPLQL